MYDVDWDVEANLAKSEAMGVLISTVLPNDKFKQMLQVSTEDQIWDSLSQPGQNPVKI